MAPDPTRLAALPSLVGVVGLEVVIIGSRAGWPLSRVLAVLLGAAMLVTALAWVALD